MQYIVYFLWAWAVITFIAAGLDEFIPAGKMPEDIEREKVAAWLKQKGITK